MYLVFFVQVNLVFVSPSKLMSFCIYFYFWFKNKNVTPSALFVFVLFKKIMSSNVYVCCFYFFCSFQQNTKLKIIILFVLHHCLFHKNT